jgi:hypothetical protein
MEPDQAYWTGYWNALSAKLMEAKNSDRSHVPVDRWRPASMPGWAYGVAALLLVAIGIYAGKTIFSDRHTGSQSLLQEQPTQTAASIPASTVDSTGEQALAYLERSRNLLIGITNLDETHHNAFGLSRHQEVSRELITQGSVLAASLNKPDQQLLRLLIQDLQIILLQLANVEVTPGVPAVQLVRKGVNEKSILLKINLEEMRAMIRKSSKQNPEAKQPNNL